MLYMSIFFIPYGMCLGFVEHFVWLFNFRAIPASICDDNVFIYVQIRQ